MCYVLSLPNKTTWPWASFEECICLWTMQSHTSCGVLLYSSWERICVWISPAHPISHSTDVPGKFNKHYVVTGHVNVITESRYYLTTSEGLPLSLVSTAATGSSTAAVFLLESLLLVSVLSKLNDFIFVVLTDVRLLDLKQGRRCLTASWNSSLSEVFSMIHSL